MVRHRMPMTWPFESYLACLPCLLASFWLPQFDYSEECVHTYIYLNCKHRSCTQLELQCRRKPIHLSRHVHYKDKACSYIGQLWTSEHPMFCRVRTLSIRKEIKIRSWSSPVWLSLALEWKLVFIWKSRAEARNEWSYRRLTVGWQYDIQIEDVVEWSEQCERRSLQWDRSEGRDGDWWIWPRGDQEGSRLMGDTYIRYNKIHTDHWCCSITTTITGDECQTMLAIKVSHNCHSNLTVVVPGLTTLLHGNLGKRRSQPAEANRTNLNCSSSGLNWVTYFHMTIRNLNKLVYFPHTDFHSYRFRANIY